MSYKSTIKYGIIQRKMVRRVLYHRCMAAKIMPAGLFSKDITGYF